MNDQRRFVGILGSSLANAWPGQFLESALAQQALDVRQLYQQTPNVCIHADCPICAKAREETLRREAEQERQRALRKLNYRKRCLAWVLRLRTLRTQKGVE